MRNLIDVGTDLHHEGHTITIKEIFLAVTPINVVPQSERRLLWRTYACVTVDGASIEHTIQINTWHTYEYLHDIASDLWDAVIKPQTYNTTSEVLKPGMQIEKTTPHRLYHVNSITVERAMSSNTRKWFWATWVSYDGVTMDVEGNPVSSVSDASSRGVVIGRYLGPKFNIIR